jgi:inner membrane protease subunit 2
VGEGNVRDGREGFIGHRLWRLGCVWGRRLVMGSLIFSSLNTPPPSHTMAAHAATELIAGLRGAARAAPLVFAFTQYGLTVTPVEGRSMQPTLNDGVGSRDAVCLDRLFAHSYERGDVVVLHSPTDPTEMVLKRVVGMGGDWVRRRGGDQSFVRVPTGYLWIEGDSERFSTDSNSYGAVPAGLVNARVLCKVWPLSEAGSRIGRVETPKERIIVSGGRSRAAVDEDSSWWMRLARGKNS